MFNLNKLPRRAVKKIKISVRKLAYEKAKHASTNSMSLDRNVNFSRKGQAKCVPESGERKGVLTITHLNLNGFFKKKILQKMTNKCTKTVILLIYFSKDVKIYSFEQKVLTCPQPTYFHPHYKTMKDKRPKKGKKNPSLVLSCLVTTRTMIQRLGRVRLVTGISDSGPRPVRHITEAVDPVETRSDSENSG